MSTTTSAVTGRPAGRGFDRHLIIVRHPGWQAVEDWLEIGERIRRIDPGIAVFVVSTADEHAEAAEAAASRPTLVFSPSMLGRFRPRRGKVYHGGPMPKFEQVRRMAAAGVRVPQTMIISKDMPPLDPARWGEFVIVKPTDIKTSSNGDGIQLMRTGRVRYIAPEDYPEGHPGRLGPMVVQQYIDTGPGVSTFRVLTLFGQPLYSEYIYGTGPGIDYSASDEVIEQSPIAIQNIEGRLREFRYDADVIALAKAAHAAIPEIPLKGVDVLRDQRTGLLYCIEVNPNSNTWIFSSRIGAAQRLAQGPEYTQARKDQLDAFGTAAHVLAAVTRREAE